MREQLNKAQYILNYGWSALVRKKDKLKLKRPEKQDIQFIHIYLYRSVDQIINFLCLGFNRKNWPENTHLSYKP
jgi:hypothetical protein